MVFKRSKLLYMLVITLFILSIIFIFLSFNTHSKNPRINPINDFVEINDYKNDWFDSPQTKYYKSVDFDARATKFFNKDPNESYIINTAINKFGDFGDMFLYGGFVRDISLSLEPRDLDFYFSVNNKEKVDKVFKEHNIKYTHIREDSTKSKFIWVQLTPLTQCQTMEKPEIVNAENDVNAMFYDCKKKVIIDLAGTGFLNNLKHKFRIVQPTFDGWAHRSYQGHVQNRGPLRVFKMFRNGYTLQDEEGKTMHDLRIWFRQKIDYYKNTRVDYPPEMENLFPILAWELFIIRGDILNIKDASIEKKGEYTKYFDEILHEIKKFDTQLYKEIIESLIIYDKTLEKYR